MLADALGNTAVITTATDVGGQFSPDSFAVANGFIITDLAAAKEIAAEVLDDEKVGFSTEYRHGGLPDELTEFGICRTGIYVGTESDVKPFDVTLRLVPRNIVLGIGCKKGTSAEAVETAVSRALAEAGIDAERVCQVATIDLKAREEGLLGFCGRRDIDLRTYTAEELMAVKGDFDSSEFVRETTGADNVCERSAVLCSGGKLVLRKTAFDGVTVAAAEAPVYLDFERNVL